MRLRCHQLRGSRVHIRPRLIELLLRARICSRQRLGAGFILHGALMRRGGVSDVGFRLRDLCFAACHLQIAQLRFGLRQFRRGLIPCRVIYVSSCANSDAPAFTVSPRCTSTAVSNPCCVGATFT